MRRLGQGVTLAQGWGLGRADVDFLGQASGWHWTVDSDPGRGHPVPGFPQSCHCCGPTMLPSRTALVLTLVLAAGFPGQGARRRPKRPSPISTIQPKANFNAQQFAGTWFLVAVASSCRSLQEQGHRAEATTLRVAPQGAAMAVNTFRKLDGICWQVRQLYGGTKVPGRFLLQARGARGEVHVVVGETDYQSFAILYLERAQRLSVKLYARSLPVSDLVVSTFEQRVQRANLTEDHILYFPKYGFCESADQFHVLDEVKR
ncbi:complement component C8 gamma chain [Saccopteryx leptura]|uniref:complement component C8 gamma chain n=1 Tax=Saccopteryx leptura TaxID=249018 RepID=UPI00339BAC4A